MAMFVSAKKQAGGNGACRLMVEEQLRLKRLKEFQMGGKRLRQVQLLSDDYPVKKIKKTIPSSDAIIKKHDDQSTNKVVVKDQQPKSGSEKPRNLIGISDAAKVLSDSQKPGNATGIKLVIKIGGKKLSEFEEQGNVVLGKKVEAGNPAAQNSLQKTNDKVRDNIREDFAKSLSKVATEVDGKEEAGKASSCDPSAVAVRVETELFKAWGPCKGPKKAKYLSVMFNLKDEKNPDFRKKVLLGAIPPDSICQLKAEDMASDARTLENQRIRELPMFKREIAPPPPEPKGEGNPELQCRRCEFSQTGYYQLQTRSADEPMTTYVTCHNCNNRWKF